jgi:hypothetical protein
MRNGTRAQLAKCADLRLSQNGLELRAGMESPPNCRKANDSCCVVLTRWGVVPAGWRVFLLPRAVAFSRGPVGGDGGGIACQSVRTHAKRTIADQHSPVSQTGRRVLMSVSQTGAFGTSSGAAGSAAVEGVAGIAVVVLTILGLGHVVPVFLVAIALIIAGIALLAQGATIAAEYARLLSSLNETTVPMGNNSAWSLALLAGGAAIVLGILALLNVAPIQLVAIGVIALGGGLIISSGPTAQTAMLKSEAATPDERVRRMVAEAASASVMSQGMVGLAAVVLGILSLAGFSSLALILIALLAMGVFLLANGTSVSGVMLSVFRR